MKSTITKSVLVLAALLVMPGAWAAEKPPGEPELAMIGQGHDLQVVPDLSRAVSVGEFSLWGDMIHVKDAFFLKPHFVGVNLRAGDAIVVRSATGKVVETITGRGPKDMGSFWGLSARGAELHLEFRFSHNYTTPPFGIDKVVVGDADPFAWSGGNLKNSCGSEDFEDVVCHQNDTEKWQTVMASVGVMTVGSSPTSGLWCSGVNVSAENYMLTADHCITNQLACDAAEFVFGYHNQNCGDGPVATDWESFRCDAIQETSQWDDCEVTPSTLDFALTSVIGDPASTFGFVNVDPAPVTDGEAVYMVQHPFGRPKQITHGSGPDIDADSPNLRYFNTMDSELGSSGAPVFREFDHRVVGLHHCSGCDLPGVGNRAVMMADIYPLIENYVCADFLDVTGVAGQGLAEVSGNGNAVLEPGETWQFDSLVRNTGCTLDALGVVGDVELNAGSTIPVTITNGAASFGDVVSGAVGAAQLPVVFEIGMGVACGESVVFDLVSLNASNGGPFPDTEQILSVRVGELVYNTFMLENFADGIPAAWTLVHNGTATGPAATWTTDNPGSRSIPLTEPYAIVDSFEAGSGVTHDEELITAPVDCTGYEEVELRFNHQFRWWSGSPDEQGDVDIRSSATGGSWVNLVNYSGGEHSGNEAIDISNYAVGQTDVEIRFHYYDASWDYWWAVDDVEIVGGVYTCGTTVEPPLFYDGFESGDTSRWSLTTD